MKSNYEILPIVEYIKNKESNRYNLNIEVETPTPRQYYQKHIKNNNLNLSETLTRCLSALTCAGYADDETGEIFVFNKNYALNYKLNNFLKYLRITSLNEALLAMTTFHEIRHILQDNKYDIFDEYEFFCITYLRVLNYKYLLDIDFHDSQYFEIDANLYSACEAKKLFSADKRINKFIDNQISIYTYEKCLYEFEEYLRYFIKMMKKGEYSDSYDDDDFMKTFWNIDGSFKTISEMLDNSNFLYGGLLESRIIASDACLSSIDYNNLSTYEKETLEVHLDNNIKFIARNIDILDDLYKNKKISKSRYKEGLDILKKQICDKEEYRKNIEKTSKKRTL